MFAVFSMLLYVLSWLDDLLHPHFHDIAAGRLPHASHPSILIHVHVDTVGDQPLNGVTYLPPSALVSVLQRSRGHDTQRLRLVPLTHLDFIVVSIFLFKAPGVVFKVILSTSLGRKPFFGKFDA